MKAYITRDGRGANPLMLWVGSKPFKCKYHTLKEWFINDYNLCRFMRISEDMLPEGVNPQWEDDEPIEVELILKKKQV